MKVALLVCEKGPASGFVGDIPLPTLDSRIEWNHKAGALYDFLLGFCHPSKNFLDPKLF